MLPTGNIKLSTSHRLDVVVELALVAVTVRSVPNLVYVNSTETMSLRPRPASSTRIEVLIVTPSWAKVTKLIVGDNTIPGIVGEAEAGVVVSGVVVSGVAVSGVAVAGDSALGSAGVSSVSIDGSVSVPADSRIGSTSALAGVSVDGVSVDGESVNGVAVEGAEDDAAGDPTLPLTLETAAGDWILASDSD